MATYRQLKYAKDMQALAAHRKALRAAEKPSANGTKGDARAQTSVPQKIKDVRLPVLRTSWQKIYATPTTTNVTERNALLPAKPGPKKTENANEKLPVAATEVPPPTSYPKLLESFDLVGSESVKLIDESAQHLFAQMKGAKSIVEACMCAEQIQKLIRLKLDIRRVTRD